MTGKLYWLLGDGDEGSVEEVLRGSWGGDAGVMKTVESDGEEDRAY